jgi:hypothetical protein
MVAGRPVPTVAHGELEHLCQVQGAAVGAVGDLLLAAEPSAITSVSSAASRMAGSSTRSPALIETW